MAGETILVVDDGRENREFVVDYVLKPNGYGALTAKDGQEGLEMALAYRPDLILLDLQMPRMNGIEVLQHLSQENADIPVILMTFHGSEDVAIEVYRLGVRDYLKKPFSVDEMLEAIERSLTEKRLRHEKNVLTDRVLHANRDLQMRIQELNVLYKVGKNVTAILDIEALLPRIVDAAAQVTQAEKAVLYLIVEGGLVCRALKQPDQEHAQAVNQTSTDRLALQVVQQGQSVVFGPAELAGHSPEVHSAVYVPLIFRERVIGILGVQHVREGLTPFSRHDSALLNTLSDYASIAIINSHNYEALRVMKERESAQIRETFEKFVPPAVVQHVLEDADSVALGGQRQNVTVLFADIHGFSQWSDEATPEQVVEILNDYFHLAAEVILPLGGTLDKFFGDGLMAVFNAPNHQGQHMYKAAEAALGLVHLGEELSARWQQSLNFSVGLSTGPAVVGYIGTEQFMNYTAVGDAVSLAKRLQEHAAPGKVFADSAVITGLGNLVQAQPLGELKIRGRKNPARIYELRSLNTR